MQPARQTFQILNILERYRGYQPSLPGLCSIFNLKPSTSCWATLILCLRHRISRADQGRLLAAAGWAV